MGGLGPFRSGRLEVFSCFFAVLDHFSLWAAYLEQHLHNNTFNISLSICCKVVERLFARSGFRFEVVLELIGQIYFEFMSFVGLKEEWMEDSLICWSSFL